MDCDSQIVHPKSLFSTIRFSKNWLHIALHTEFYQFFVFLFEAVWFHYLYGTLWQLRNCLFQPIQMFQPTQSISFLLIYLPHSNTHSYQTSSSLEHVYGLLCTYYNIGFITLYKYRYCSLVLFRVDPYFPCCTNIPKYIFFSILSPFNSPLTIIVKTMEGSMFLLCFWLRVRFSTMLLRYKNKISQLVLTAIMKHLSTLRTPSKLP